MVIIRIVGFLFIAFFMVACNSQNKGEKHNEQIIYVSIEPQKYLVEEIAGGLFEVQNMLPPGASPATFEPSPVQFQKLSKAKAYLRIGHIGFEQAWMEKIKSTNKKMKIFDQSKGVDFIEADHVHHHDGHAHHQGAIDPHIWVSTSQMYKQINNIKEMLTELMPDSAQYFKTNHNNLKVIIADTDKAILSLFENVEKKTFMVYHPSLSYFARDYGLTQLPLEYDGKEPSGKYMMELIEKSKKLNINKIFIQKQFPVSKAEAIAKELNAEVVKIDPLAYNWPQNMYSMAKQIQKSLVE